MATVLELGITVGLSLTSLYVGMVAGGAQQDRESFRRQRGVAKVLLADLARIDQELTRVRELGLLRLTRGLEGSVPTIHPWVESLIAQVADEVPDAIADYMRLQNALRQTALSATAAAQTLASMEQASDHFEAANTARREAHSPGRYIAEDDRWERPEDLESLATLPEEREALTQLLSHSDELTARAAAAKIEWMDWRDALERTMSVFRVMPEQAMGVLMELERRLIPIASRSIPTLPTLVLSAISPVSEDKELQRLADERALRQHGYEPRDDEGDDQPSARA